MVDYTTPHLCAVEWPRRCTRMRLSGAVTGFFLPGCDRICAPDFVCLGQQTFATFNQLDFPQFGEHIDYTQNRQCPTELNPLKIAASPLSPSPKKCLQIGSLRQYAPHPPISSLTNKAPHLFPPSPRIRKFYVPGILFLGIPSTYFPHR